MNENVLVIEKETASKLGLLDGQYTPMSDALYMKVLTALSMRHMIPRDQAEHDERYLQVIPYVTVLAGDGDEVLAYRRSGTEGRLRDYYSIGFGGHVSQQDYGCVKCALEREIAEELGYAISNRTVRLVGLIYDSSTEVSRVHLGLHYVCPLFADNLDILKPSDEIAELRRVRIDEATRLNLESWSRLCIDNANVWRNAFAQEYARLKASTELIRRALQQL